MTCFVSGYWWLSCALPFTSWTSQIKQSPQVGANEAQGLNSVFISMDKDSCLFIFFLSLIVSPCFFFSVTKCAMWVLWFLHFLIEVEMWSIIDLIVLDLLVVFWLLSKNRNKNMKIKSLKKVIKRDYIIVTYLMDTFCLLKVGRSYYINDSGWTVPLAIVVWKNKYFAVKLSNFSPMSTGKKYFSVLSDVGCL